MKHAYTFGIMALATIFCVASVQASTSDSELVVRDEDNAADVRFMAGGFARLDSKLKLLDIGVDFTGQHGELYGVGGRSSV